MSLNSADSAEDTVTMTTHNFKNPQLGRLAMIAAALGATMVDLNKVRKGQPNHDAAANNAAVNTAIADGQQAGVQKARARLSDIQDKLEVEYIRPTELAALGPFNIVDAHVREKRGEFGVQCEYECVLLTGEQAGAAAFLTLNESPTRRKLVEMVQRHGSIGPVVLRPVGKEIRGNQPWGFVEPGTPEAEGAVAATASE